MALNQSFSFSGQSNAVASTAGSSATDHTNSISAGTTAASFAFVNSPPCD
jgi:hypothetical protein